ncbi:hypothetical protein CYMTET_9600 [Cymbomonas tetramitiformis]|uniref:Uncharacterized protein n=1 Tax=Cymbomonas tetramitiformis TaxID=36881 RepID=A0AAE0BI72_9CHLO|nr:hypothetical protein CYMTET_53404 [Cymbomonas tetramitiformis]KAK3282674.1 hypothetical protein CYMTET_9600 [Cymbomonas tetramitiformis]
MPVQQQPAAPIPPTAEMPVQQQPAAPIPAPVTLEIFTQDPEAPNVATAFAAPAQTKPTAPKTLPKVVAEGSFRAGKNKAKKGPAVRD